MRWWWLHKQGTSKHKHPPHPPGAWMGGTSPEPDGWAPTTHMQLASQTRRASNNKHLCWPLSLLHKRGINTSSTNFYLGCIACASYFVDGQRKERSCCSFARVGAYRDPGRRPASYMSTSLSCSRIEAKKRLLHTQECATYSKQRLLQSCLEQLQRERSSRR